MTHEKDANNLARPERLAAQHGATIWILLGLERATQVAEGRGRL
jgi:hypothetical protein